MDNVALSTQITASLFGFSDTCPDDPYGGSPGVGITIPGWGDGVWGTQIVFDYNGQAPFFRTFFSFGQSVGDWIKLATATPPQEYELPLADGWLPIDARYGVVYWKTQESIVNISLSLKSDHTVTNGEIIATLPAGFRPKKSLKIPITVVNQNELLVHGYVDINRSDGSIQIYKITDQIKELCFPTTNFLANG